MVRCGSLISLYKTKGSDKGGLLRNYDNELMQSRSSREVKKYPGKW